MKRTDRKSACPINFCLESVGDPWSLLILRDIIFVGKRTFKEFLSSPERITTSVLAARLADLEERGILTREPHPSDGRRDNYVLTEKGLSLIPLILEMFLWGTAHDPKSDGHRMLDFVAKAKNQRAAFARRIIDKVRNGGAVFD